MNKILEEYKNKFKLEFAYEKKYLSEDEEKEIRPADLLDNGSQNYAFDESNHKWYKKVLIDVPNDQFNTFIFMAMLDAHRDIKEKQTTIKNIMVFWVILTILNLIGEIYIVIKLIG